jgi:hypothetical protein
VALMGRPWARRKRALTRAQLDHLAAWVAGLVENAALAGNPDPSMVLRCATVDALLRQARFGVGLATLQAQSKAQRVASARKAATARWARARAERDIGDGK